MKGTPAAGRVNLFILGVFAVSILIVYRLFDLSLVNHQNFLKTAQSQRQNGTALAERGNIYFSDRSDGTRKIVATNKTAAYLTANNKQLTEPAAVIADKLAPIIKQDAAIIAGKLSPKDKSYVVLAADLTPDQAVKCKALKIKGIAVTNQIDRVYPLSASAGQLLGFVGFAGKNRAGQYGLEAYYDRVLSGSNVGLTGPYARISDWLNPFSKNDKKAQAEASEGGDLVLSIDKNIQALAETKLAAVLKKWDSPSGTIIIQDPRTGEILAMASLPGYDPNAYSQYSLKNFINPAVQEVYEPGSSFKPITMAGAVDSGKVSPETTYYDSGEAKIAGYTIKNFDEKSHGTQTMRQVLEHSLNTGAIFAQNKIGDDAFLNYVVAFGFGQKTAVDLSGEVPGNIANLYEGRKINFATAAFGQGIAVTPLQLVNAYSAIANGGKLMQPRVVKEIIARDGLKTVLEPKVIGSPISESTARRLQSMLVDVVDKGFDRARIAGYDVAGKTGTAQIASSGGYLADDQFIHNFVGFAPAYNARFTILIKMDRPKGIKFAADSLSPVFGDIARYLIRYFNLPPTR